MVKLTDEEIRYITALINRDCRDRLNTSFPEELIKREDIMRKLYELD